MVNDLPGQSGELTTKALYERLRQGEPAFIDTSFYRSVAYALAREQGLLNPDWEKEFRLALADFLIGATLPDSAETIIQPIISTIDRWNPDVYAAKGLHLLGKIRFFQQRMPESLLSQQRAVELYKKLGSLDDSNYANAHRLAGELGARVGDFNEAVEHYRSAISLYERQQDTSAYFLTVHNLAQMLGVKGFYELAEQERQLIYSHAAEREQYEVLAMARLVSAIDLLRQKRFEEMRLMLDEAGRTLKKIDFDPQLQYFFHRFNMAYAYAVDDAEYVKPHFRAMEQLYEELQNSGRFQNIFARDEATYLYMVGDYAAALRKISAAYAAVKDRTDVPDRLTYFELLKDINRKAGNELAAWRFAELEAGLRDSMRRESQLTQTAYYENLYEKEQEKLRRAEREAELEKIDLINQGRIRVFVFVTVIVFLLLLAYHLSRVIRYGKREEKLQQRFSQDLLLTREKEQRRIARELHDGVAQDLLLLQKNAGSLDTAEIADGTNSIFQKVRAISHELYIPGPERLGLSVAIEQLVDRFDRASPLFFSTEIADELPAFSRDIQNNLFAILQESLQNVVKHAKAKAVRVELMEKPLGWTLRVIDNGTGFSPENEHNGIGLRTMKERARMMGGTLRLYRDTNDHTIVELSFTK